MGIVTKIEPGRVVSLDEFFSTFPAFSIAGDGFCSGPPGTSPDGLLLNINHHGGVNRFATRASCAQAHVRVKMGLFDFFQKNGHHCATIWINHCDQDVGLMDYVLEHPEDVNRPMLRELVRVEDLMDMSSGLYPVRKKWHIVRKLAWIGEPYTEARLSGELMRLQLADDIDGLRELMRTVIAKMARRIKRTLYGGGQELKLDTKYEVVEDFGRWQFVREIGQHARLGMMENGVKAFVTLLGEKDGTYHYVYGRQSDLVRFPLPEIIEDLNEAEGIAPDDEDKHGGADTIGGSPRDKGSKLPPERVCDIIARRIEIFDKENQRRIEKRSCCQ